MTSSITPVAIVTGGRQGLGRAAVESLAARGFDIAVVDLHEADQPIEALVADVARQGRTARYYRLDIADIASHADLVDAVWADFGRIDCLHNNAGVAARPLTDILDLGPEAFDRAIEVNLRGTFFLSQAVARRMVADESRRHDGVYRSILLVSSIAAELVSTDRSQYCISKAGVSMLAKLLGVRLGREGIAVHEIRPGFIRSAMTASAPTSVIDEWIADGRVPVPRWGTPEDVGAAVASLAAGDLPYMTGQPFWIAGGLNIPQAT